MSIHYSLADDLAFTALPLETQQLVRKLAAGGYFVVGAVFTQAQLDEARLSGYDEGYRDGHAEGYAESSSE